ncbi:MAG: Phenolic acid decarboxylase subunit C [Syntrophorhabdaceae bacterium PtaU1.Bin034]|nr:MAG: Phenolic acid decarboxylase subunit C [Syntrophorhabdaceae bacterium PtaU1.Bin034]
MSVEYDDLRGYIEVLEASGCLKKVENADWNVEIGAICEMNSERKGNALLFDKIKGYPEGYRILTNFLFQPKKVQRLAFGIPDSMSDNDIIFDWKDKLVNYRPIPPVVVDSGPVMENIQTGDDIDMFKFPAPFWHIHDGGRYIGTGDLNINRDPDTGYVNIGTYRVMIHEKNMLSYYMSPGAHGQIIREKYWQQGKDCPVVLCFGQDPMIFAASTMQIPWGQSEYDFAGYIKGRPIKVIIDEVTGLPIPAAAEIAIAGFAPPPDKENRLEGPFGEWTGYYASEPYNRPLIHVEKVYHRNNPIITGAPLNKFEPAWYEIPIHYAPNIWERLLAFGMPGIKGVWSYGRGGRTIAVISINQSYLGHARAVGTIAAMIPRGAAMSGKYTIVVDDDIDPSNWDEVAWALSSRVEPETQIDILRGHLNTPLDPAVPPNRRARQDYTMGRVVIDACRPFNWRHEYSEVISYPAEVKKQLGEKFAYLWQ